jgi:hypothetical protein
MSPQLLAATIGLLGVVVGVGLKAIIDWLLERSKAKTARQVGARDTQREVYEAFVAATLELASVLQYGARQMEDLKGGTASRLDALLRTPSEDAKSQARQRFLHELARVRMFGSEFAEITATDVMRAVESDQGDYVGMYLMRFIAASRRELG